MYVNYITECEAFIRHARDNGYSGSAQLLWRALFTIFNEHARRNGGDWPDGFIRVSNKELLSWLPFTENTLIATRAEMVNPKRFNPILFDYIPGKKSTEMPQYRLHYFSPDAYLNSRGNMGGNVGGNPGGSLGGNMRGNPGGNIGDIYNKLNTGQAREDRTHEKKLYYNNAWKGDARARSAVAQNILDALPNIEPDGLNSPKANSEICRYLGLGMTPEQVFQCLDGCSCMAYVPYTLRNKARKLGFSTDDE